MGELLVSAGLPPSIYAGLFVGLNLAAVAAFIVIAGGVLWRRSDDALVVVNACWFVAFPVTVSLRVMEVAAADRALDPLAGAPIVLLGWPFLLVFFYLFPDGLFVPRWGLAPGLLLLALEVATTRAWPPLAAPLVWTVFLALGLVAQWRRHQRVPNPADRRQSQGVVVGLAVIALLALAWTVPGVAEPAHFQPGSLYLAGAALLTMGGLLLIPLMIGASVIRHRLFQIDVIINRALVYITLTVILVLVYLLSVVLLQRAFRALTGQEHDLAIIVSTLAIAALFQPLRARLQDFIDRRFYRRKYDASLTLAAFSARLRDDVDLAALSQELAAVVRETMQPSHVSLWLRSSATSQPAPETEQATGTATGWPARR